MTKAEQDALLAKAHGAKHILERMKKASADFHGKMTKLHKAHEDDMSAAMGQLHKVLGVMDTDGPGTGGGEPVAEPLTSSGTHNLQDFGKTVSTNTGVTAEQVQTMMTKMFDEFAGALLGKAKKQPAEDDEEECPDCGKATCECNKVAKGVGAHALSFGTGVGSRREVQQPVARVAGGMGKAADTGGSAQPVNPLLTMTEAQRAELVAKAAGGDQEAALTLMKGAKPVDLPNTLTEALSKIH